MIQPQRLRGLLQRKDLVTAMAAHNPLTAILVEEAGFDAVWASGFELSAAYGVPDSSIVSFAEHLGMTQRMVGRIQIPVIADIDTGYGNAANVHYVVRAYARVGAAAVVMEDKHFPKITSLREDGQHKLVSIGEFTGKIQSAIDARESTEMVVIARTEALIAGLGMDVALQRAQAYCDAGADLILVHSKADTATELLDFVELWKNKTPLVIVPTAYPQFGEEDAIKAEKIKVLIYGNHTVRASVAAIRDVFSTIRVDKGAGGVSRSIASVKDIIALQGEAEFQRIERDFVK